MVTLKPPFRAENMEGLYNRVIKGQFNKISEKFSADLSEIIKMLIQVHPEIRPNCGIFLLKFRSNIEASNNTKAA
jgi:NIMA (never in mitosis gene a)-related kinase